MRFSNKEEKADRTDSATYDQKLRAYRTRRIVAVAAVLAAISAAVVWAQDRDKDKYSLKSPGGIAFSDFAGYEDWAVISSARTDEVLKVIIASPAMIKAYKAGVPGNDQPFPEHSMIVKLQWTPKKSPEAPFAVDVPDVFKQAFVMEKDSKRFPKTRWLGIRGLQLRFSIEQVHCRSHGASGLWKHMPPGREGEGLHLPLVPEALNRVEV